MKAFNAFNLFTLLTALCASAQVQEAWVVRYNNGLSNHIHQAVAMALDTNGNIYVVGSSESVPGNSDYALIKYAPNGRCLWTQRYGSARDEYPNALVLDHVGNAIITGSGGTVKYTSAGALLWSNAHAGNDVAIDLEDNIIVTGFSTNDFATVKFSAMGSNLWVRTYDGHGYADISQRVTTDSAGNVCIAGASVWSPNRPPGILPYYELATIKYDATGTQIWAATFRPFTTFVRVAKIAFDRENNFVVCANLSQSGYVTRKYSSGSGSNIWAYGIDGATQVRDMALDGNDKVYMTGSLFSHFIYFEYGTIKLNSNGTEEWLRRYNGTTATDQAANSLTIDKNSNVYITGFSPGQNTGNDFATIKYDNEGDEIWVKRYNGPVDGNDEGKAIAVDASGAIYVAGTSANTNGGTDIVLIRYAQLQTIQVLTNGYTFLQFFGTPGQSYRFQASINLSNWVEMGSSVADTNGIYRFVDTNAPAYPHRFYRTVSP
jgi:uncharacterized delta-60 repeat protein